MASPIPQLPAEPLVFPNPNPSPKARFLGVKGYVTTHKDLILRDDLQRGIDYALLEYQLRVAQTTGEQMAGAGHYKIVGALEFISILKTLAETQQPQPIKRPQQIDHTA